MDAHHLGHLREVLEAGGLRPVDPAADLGDA